MTDATPPTFDADDFMARYRAYEERASALHPPNKAALFAALAATGITSVTVTFDGYGDSGQIEGFAAKAGDSDAELPDTPVELAGTSFGSDEIVRTTNPLPDAIEAFCYRVLESKHGGWENNEGAYGEFVLDVVAGTVEFDFNYRIETSENHFYEL
ncbi:MAG: hypothetical protein CL802_01010 [Citromicrobium sp.]|nr:hypothetical protein [Citromicrobium sp.]|tara:strand:- start:2266 stop:2733 length:468 start_codon:yes stop_codon:yes gene_type:complete